MEKLREFIQPIVISDPLEMEWAISHEGQTAPGILGSILFDRPDTVFTRQQLFATKLGADSVDTLARTHALLEYRQAEISKSYLHINAVINPDQMAYNQNWWPLFVARKPRAVIIKGSTDLLRNAPPQEFKRHLVDYLTSVDGILIEGESPKRRGIYQGGEFTAPGEKFPNSRVYLYDKIPFGYRGVGARVTVFSNPRGPKP